MTDVFDLFGHPVTPGRGLPGRPRKVATPEDRNKVKLLLAAGWNNERIANTVRMSLPTFRRNFFHELSEREQMRDRLEARRLEMAWEQAQKGNVGAMRQFDRLLDRNDSLLADKRIRDAQGRGSTTDVDEAPKVLGKKAQAAEEAKSAGQDSAWGNLLTPGLAN